MPRWSKFTPEEVERRRKESVEAMAEREREDFDRWYQEHCDRQYWELGQCCAGCDHWRSAGGLSGQCAAAGIVSGEDVLRSMGISFSSHLPAPDLPYTRSDFYCGKFKDDFDWPSLGEAYLKKIGALKNGRIRKPLPPAPTPGDTHDTR